MLQFEKKDKITHLVGKINFWTEFGKKKHFNDFCNVFFKVFVQGPRLVPSTSFINLKDTKM